MHIRTALLTDLSTIVTIYNQAIPTKRITADLEPMTEQQRLPWFEFHQQHSKYPLWVLENKQKIVGWCNFSPFYPRKAFDQTVEISLYLDQSARGKGYGKSAVEFMKTQMQACQVCTLMAYVMEENQIISSQLFESQGFQQWGRYPNIANMGDRLQTFLMYGFQRINDEIEE